MKTRYPSSLLSYAYFSPLPAFTHRALLRQASSGNPLMPALRIQALDDWQTNWHLSICCFSHFPPFRIIILQLATLCQGLAYKISILIIIKTYAYKPYVLKPNVLRFSYSRAVILQEFLRNKNKLQKSSVSKNRYLASRVGDS
jgi:hypothetical protein